MYSTRIRLFGENDFHKWEQGWSQALKDKIQKEARDYLLNVNESEYVEHLTDTYSVEPVELHLAAAEATDAERTVAEAVWLAGHRPSSTDRTMPVYTFHIPFTGLAELLWCKPTTGYPHTLEVQVDESLQPIAFDVASGGNDAGFVNSQYQESAMFIREQSVNLGADTERYKAAVPCTGLGLCMIGSRIRQEIRVADSACPGKKKPPRASAALRGKLVSGALIFDETSSPGRGRIVLTLGLFTKSRAGTDLPTERPLLEREAVRI